MVAAVFHGDPRFSKIRVEDLSQLANVLLNFDRLTEMIFLRPLSLKVMLDRLLAEAAVSERAAVA